MNNAKTNNTYTVIASACIDKEGEKRVGAIFYKMEDGKPMYRGRMFSQYAGPWQDTKLAAERDIADFMEMEVFIVDTYK